MTGGPLRRPTPAPNYVYFSGSALRFGRLTMTGADLEIVDADAATPFDFFPREYAKQLVAGYSLSTVSGALIAYMPDYAAAARGVRLRAHTIPSTPPKSSAVPPESRVRTRR